jgi:hypothetical protein
MSAPQLIKYQGQVYKLATDDDTVYCEKCGRPLSDAEAAEAVDVNHEMWCKQCAAKAGKHATVKQADRDLQATRELEKALMQASSEAVHLLHSQSPTSELAKLGKEVAAHLGAAINLVISFQDKHK